MSSDAPSGPPRSPNSSDSQSNQTQQQQSPTSGSWDGDRMFNIYIYDYFHKRGFRAAADALRHEANIPQDSQPPINARQGLLFEWWSVFWVLFTAKSNGTGSEDAILYTQHQAAQTAQRQQAARAAHARYTANGMPRQPPAPPMTNGGSGSVISTLPATQGSLPNGTQGAIPFPGGVPQSQTNGITGPGPSAGVSGGGGAPPPQGQGMPQQQGLVPNQRSGGPPQQRGANGAPFQSPTMAHSPHSGGSAGQAPSSVMTGLGQVGGSQPLTQMNRGGMLPPPPQSGGPGGMGGQQTSQAAFQSLVGRSPSQPGSPAQNHLLTAPSPSMSARQPPSVAANAQQIEQEFMRMPPPQANQIKAEIGCGDKDLNSLNLEEKQHRWWQMQTQMEARMSTQTWEWRQVGGGRGEEEISAVYVLASGEQIYFVPLETKKPSKWKFGHWQHCG